MDSDSFSEDCNGSKSPLIQKIIRVRYKKNLVVIKSVDRFYVNLCYYVSINLLNTKQFNTFALQII